MRESMKDEWADVIRELSPQNQQTMTAMVKLAKIAENAAFHAAEDRTDQETAPLPQYPSA